MSVTVGDIHHTNIAKSKIENFSLVMWDFLKAFKVLLHNLRPL